MNRSRREATMTTASAAITLAKIHGLDSTVEAKVAPASTAHADAARLAWAYAAGVDGVESSKHRRQRGRPVAIQQHFRAGTLEIVRPDHVVPVREREEPPGGVRQIASRAEQQRGDERRGRRGDRLDEHKARQHGGREKQRPGVSEVQVQNRHVAEPVNHRQQGVRIERVVQHPARIKRRGRRHGVRQLGRDRGVIRQVVAVVLAINDRSSRSSSSVDWRKPPRPYRRSPGRGQLPPTSKRPAALDADARPSPARDGHAGQRR